MSKGDAEQKQRNEAVTARIAEIARERKEADAQRQRSKTRSHDERTRDAVDRFANTIKTFNEKNGGSDSFEKARREAVRIAELAERKKR